nr:MAG TPA: hypothetical protein [Caudoviricetes sp.]
MCGETVSHGRNCGICQKDRRNPCHNRKRETDLRLADPPA